MNDYLTRLAGRALGTLPLVQPCIPPRFAPRETDGPASLEVDVEVEAPAAVVRAPTIARPRDDREAPVAAPSAPEVAPPSEAREHREAAVTRGAPLPVSVPALRSAPVVVEVDVEHDGPNDLAPALDATLPAREVRVRERTLVPIERRVVTSRSHEAPQAPPLLPPDMPSFEQESFAEPAVDAEPLEARATPHAAVTRAAPASAPVVRPVASSEVVVTQTEAPVVRVTIGRIELRAAPSARQAPPAPRASAPAPRSNLEEYLRQRARRPQGGSQ